MLSRGKRNFAPARHPVSIKREQTDQTTLKMTSVKINRPADNLRLRGYILGIIAAASYGTNPLFALPLYEAGLTPDGVLFLRYITALPILAAMIFLRGQSFRVTLRQLGVMILLGLLVALSSLTLFCSYNHMDVGIASTILFVYPIMVAVIMACVFRERVSAVTVLCIGLATVGISMLMKAPDGSAVSFTGTVLVLLSALTYALYIVAVNKTSLVRIATLTITFYILLFGVGLFAARLSLDGLPLFPRLPQWHLWLCVLGLAVFPTAISFACTNGAIQTIGSTPTAILGAFEPVTAVIIGVAVFGETLTPRSIFGIALIVIAVVCVIAGPGIQKPLTHVRRLFPRRKRH